jgi:hypothetical protein
MHRPSGRCDKPLSFYLGNAIVFGAVATWLTVEGDPADWNGRMGWVMGLLWFFTAAHVVGLAVMLWRRRRP